MDNSLLLNPATGVTLGIVAVVIVAVILAACVVWGVIAKKNKKNKK